MSKRAFGEVPLLPSRRLVRPVADDNFLASDCHYGNIYVSSFQNKIFEKDKITLGILSFSMVEQTPKIFWVRKTQNDD